MSNLQYPYYCRDHSGKAWISFNDQGRPTVYSSMFALGNCKSPPINGINTSDGFTANLKSKKKIAISYDYALEGKVLDYEFQAPDVTFSNIHDFKTSVIDVALNHESLAVSVDSTGVVKIWETSTGTVRRVLNGHLSGAVRAKFFPSGTVVLTGGEDCRLKVWSVGTGLCAATFIGHTGVITDMAIVGKGRNFVSTSTDGTAKLWDSGSQKCLATVDDNVSAWNCCTLGQYVCQQNSQVRCQPEEFDTSSKMLLVGTESSQILSFSLQHRKKIFDFSCDSAVNCVSFVSDDLFVAGTENGTLYLLDKRNVGDAVKVQQPNRGSIKSLFASNNCIIISTGDGSCFSKDSSLHTSLEFTGSDIDAVYRVSGRCASGSRNLSEIYSCSRDGSIRKYLVNYGS